MTTRITTQNITDATITTTDIASSVPLAVDWQAVQTADFTAVAGKGYFVDSSGGAKTVTLPASPSIGDSVAIHALDGATNAVTIARNSSNIEGSTNNQILNSNYAAVTLVYSDAANGWVKHNDEVPDSFIVATGGTVSTSGDYKLHEFNSSSNFVVSGTSNNSDNNIVSYMVVAGGGGGGGNRGGGGGGGGFREGRASNDSYTVSPLNAPAGITVSAQTYPITIGSGGTGEPGPTNGSSGTKGSNSVFATITSAGGGGGRDDDTPDGGRSTGGSGGGGGGGANPNNQAGAGNTPPVSPPQGNNGGSGTTNDGNGNQGGGGGGATAVGVSNSSPVSHGGAGASSEISGSAVTRAGGGGAGAVPGRAAGNQGDTSASNGAILGSAAGNAANNRGGGGGGGAPVQNGGNGGSGVVIIKYKYQ